jgi:hypothetical protein
MCPLLQGQALALSGQISGAVLFIFSCLREIRLSRRLHYTDDKKSYVQGDNIATAGFSLQVFVKVHITKCTEIQPVGGAALLYRDRRSGIEGRILRNK